jgi:hypothetical protein
VAVPVVVTGVLVLVGPLVDDGRLGGQHHPRHRGGVQHRRVFGIGIGHGSEESSKHR